MILRVVLKFKQIFIINAKVMISYYSFEKYFIKAIYTKYVTNNNLYRYYLLINHYVELYLLPLLPCTIHQDDSKSSLNIV